MASPEWRLPGGEGQLDLWGSQQGPARDFVRAHLCDFSRRCFEELILLPTGHPANTRATFVSCVAEEYPARILLSPRPPFPPDPRTALFVGSTYRVFRKAISARRSAIGNLSPNS